MISEKLVEVKLLLALKTERELFCLIIKVKGLKLTVTLELSCQ